MRRILGTIGVVAVAAAAGFAVADGGGDAQVYQGTVDPAKLQGASAELEVSDDGATLAAERVPEPRPGEAYQVWLKRPGVDSPEPTSALFLPRGDGSATAAVRGDLDGVESVLVTREPRGGSNTPSEDPVMTIALSNVQAGTASSSGTLASGSRLITTGLAAGQDTI